MWKIRTVVFRSFPLLVAASSLLPMYYVHRSGRDVVASSASAGAAAVVRPAIGAEAGGTADRRRNKGGAPFAFAACLLLQDDNKILSEWIAYHYQFLPLRRLIVSADPGNVTTPEPIFDRWRDMGLRVDVWPGEAPSFVTDRHRFFLRRCLLHLRGENWTWTAVLDSDEYVLFNRVMENEPDPAICNFTMGGGVRNMSGRECTRRVHAPRLRLPAVGSVTAAEYIRDNTHENSIWKRFPCVIFPRVFFGPQESSAEEISKQVPSGFDATAFQTLRYRKFQFLEREKPGKSIVDVRRYYGRDFLVHRVMRNQCSYRTPYPPLFDALFRVHHYTSSLEVFLSRPNDWRRTKQEYDERANFTPVGSDDDIRGWLRAFVDNVGEKKALELTVQARARAFIDDSRVRENLMRNSSNKNTTT